MGDIYWIYIGYIYIWEIYGIYGRGPETQSQPPINRETGYSNVLPDIWLGKMRKSEEEQRIGGLGGCVNKKYIEPPFHKRN